MRYHLTPVRMAIIKISTKKKKKSWRACGEKGTFLHCWWEYKLIQTLWKIVWRFLKKPGVKLQHDSVIALLGIYTEETIIEKDTCPNVHSSTVYNSQDMEATCPSTSGRCPSTDEWIKKMWSMYTMEYYSATKKKKIWVSSHEVDEPREYWSGLPFPSPGDLPDTGIEAWSPALQADSLPSEPPGKTIQSEVSQKEKNKYCILMHIYGI